jgi:hypothetical protein
MSVPNKKSRMVSFRLSPFEFTSAEADCERHGIRSVSGLARRALLGVLAQHDSDPNSGLLAEVPVDLKLERLRIEISDLRAQFDRLRQALLPSGDPSAPPASLSAQPASSSAQSPSAQNDPLAPANVAPTTLAASVG